jgi:hypothetical protein
MHPGDIRDVVLTGFVTGGRYAPYTDAGSA